jgi:hypothetical protein
MNLLLSTTGLALSLCLFVVADAMEATFCSARKKNWSSGNSANKIYRGKETAAEHKNDLEGHSGS